MTAFGRLRDLGAMLGVAACLVGGCGVERVSAVYGDGNPDGGSPVSSTDGSSGSPVSSSGSDGSSAGDAGGDGGIALACARTDAAFTSSDPEGQWKNGGYFVRNDAWNSDAGPQTLTACSYSNWNVVANEPSTPDVKSYPDVQMDFQAGGAADGTGLPITSFTSITSKFAETSPHVGVYDVAYDIYLDSSTLDGPGTTEIMIWVDNYMQVPAGSKVSSAVPLDNRTYDVYYEADNGNGGHYIVFLANTGFSAGTVDILALLDYATQQGWLPAGAPLNQIAFGVEICETNGADATFQFTDFSIAAN